MAQTGTVAEQHEEIRFSIERLRLVAKWDGSSLADQHLRRVIEMDLNALSQLLASHFAFEEKGGYMHWIVDSRTELKPEAQRLQKQHQEILKELAGLLGRVPQTPVDDLKVAVNQVLDRIGAHEAAENKFLHS